MLIPFPAHPTLHSARLVYKMLLSSPPIATEENASTHIYYNFATALPLVLNNSSLTLVDDNDGHIRKLYFYPPSPVKNKHP